MTFIALKTKRDRQTDRDRNIACRRCITVDSVNIAIAAMQGYISTKEAMYFYLSVSMLRLKNCCQRVPMNFFRAVEWLTSNGSFNFAADPDRGIFNGIFTTAEHGSKNRAGSVALRWPLRLAICECFSETVDSTAAVCDVQGATKKSSHKIICCFLSNRLEFQCEILVAYVTILFTVKRHLIIFKYDEVIDILADHLAIFFAWCEKVFITYHSCLTLPLSTTAINDRHASHSNGFKSTARNSSEMISGLQIRRSSDSWTTMFGGAMLEAYHKLYPKPESITDIKEALQMI